MNFGDFLHSKRWKLIQNYIYSWGASVVLIGALFKLEHLKGASVFLGVGLSIEAIIFFISAFEPLMENPDWKRVFPQMRTGHENDKEKGLYKKLDDLYSSPSSGKGGGNLTVTGDLSGTIVAGGGSLSFKDLPEEQVKKLNESLRKLTETAESLRQMSSAAAATDGFVKSLNDASASVSKVIGANEKMSAEIEKAGDGISKSMVDLTDSYKTSVGNIKASGEKAAKEIEQTAGNFNTQLKSSVEEINSTYKSMTSTLTTGFKALDKNSGKYAENMDKLNKNMAALNAAYELQLQGAGKVEEMVGAYSKGVTEVSKLLQKSVEETRKFNENTKEINDNIQALNKVYGNMLGALNVKK